MWYSVMQACVWQPLLTCWHLTVDLHRQAVSKQHIYIVIVRFDVSENYRQQHWLRDLWIDVDMKVPTVDYFDSRTYMYLHCTCYHGDNWTNNCCVTVTFPSSLHRLSLGDELLSQGICQFCWHYLTTEFCFLWSAMVPDLVLRTGGVLAHSPWFLFLYSTINHSV